MAEQDLDRLFLALWPPRPVVSHIEEILPRDLDALRWQPADRWHVTVAFLGQRSLPRELSRLEKMPVGGTGDIRVRGSGTFGPILWLGVEHGEWLARLARDCRRIFGVDERQFRAHITVARARNDRARHELRVATQRLGAFLSDSWVPSDLTLVRSTTGPQPRYDVVGRRWLGDSDAGATSDPLCEG